MLNSKENIIKKIKQFADNNNIKFFYGQETEFNLWLNQFTDDEETFMFLQDNTGSSIRLSDYGNVEDGVISFVVWLGRPSDYTAMKTEFENNKFGRFSSIISPLRNLTDIFVKWLSENCANPINYVNVTDYYNEFDFNLDGVKIRLNLGLSGDFNPDYKDICDQCYWITIENTNN